MSAAFNSTFTAAIPGMSLTHKMGSLPHEKPPKYTDPNEALEYFWKQFNRKDMLKQIWQLLQNGATVWAIRRAILYKACLEGVIQMNLAVLIAKTVDQMLITIGKSKGIEPKLNPKFKDPIKDGAIQKHINDKLQRKDNPKIPPSALKYMNIPKAQDITSAMEKFTGKKRPKNGLLKSIKE